MSKQLTIELDDDIYARLHQLGDREQIGSFIAALLRPYLIERDLDAAYAHMAADSERETAALEWADACIGDVIDE